MPQITQVVLDGLTKAYNTSFNKSFLETNTYYPRYTMTVPSSTRETVFTWLGAFPRLREWVGDKVIKGLSKHGYSIVNKDFEMTIAVKRSDIEDDQYGIYTPMAEEIGRSAKIWADELIAELIKAGHERTCYDGQYFFDTDHPVGKGNVSNYFDGAGDGWYLIDTAKSIKPFILQERKKPEFVSQTKMDSDDVFNRAEYKYGVEARGNAGYGLWQLCFASKQELNRANFKALRAAISAQKDDEGKVLAIKPTLLVIPQSLQDAAEELFLREQIDGSNNTLYKAIEVLVVPYL